MTYVAPAPETRISAIDIYECLPMSFPFFSSPPSFIFEPMRNEITANLGPLTLDLERHSKRKVSQSACLPVVLLTV